MHKYIISQKKIWASFMPKGSKPKGDEQFVRSSILSSSFVNAIGLFDPIPPREKIREELSKPPINILDRSHRVVLVEDLGDYKVYIEIPGSKTDYDFFVWRAVFDSSGSLKNLKIPTHDDLGKVYLMLKKRDSVLEEYLINATFRFIRDRWPLNSVLNRYFPSLSHELVSEVKRFLLTLKWIAVEEDANYPPPNLGSSYALSVYAVLEVTGDLRDIRKIIRFPA